MRANETLTAEMNANVRFYIPVEIRCDLCEDGEGDGHYGDRTKEVVKKYRWQDFEKRKAVKKNDQGKKTRENAHAHANKGNSIEALGMLGIYGIYNGMDMYLGFLWRCDKSVALGGRSCLLSLFS
jgi:hypothetical protein